MNELPFKIATGILLLMQAVTRARYRKVRETVRRGSIRHEGRERVIYVLVSVAWVVVVLYPVTSWLDRFHIPIPGWIRWVGSGILLIGNLLFWWSHAALGRNWSPVTEIRVGHQLVTSGPYRYIRHPMYAAFFLAGIGLSLLTANWVVACAYLGSVTLMYVLRVSSEEEMMLEQFGDAYRDYMDRTGRLVPRLYKK